MTLTSIASASSLRPREFACSEVFERTFTEGMDLVEEAAAYLDGPGREDARALSRTGALAYAGESMRLTTRLMQVASWLMVQRALREEDMTVDEASQERYRVNAVSSSRAYEMDAYEALPPRLKDLVERSQKLYDRVRRLDEQLYTGQEVAESPVQRQLAKLETALSSFARNPMAGVR